jgi:hypothetical protein
VSLFAAASVAHADVIVNVPFVHLRIARRVEPPPFPPAPPLPSTEVPPIELPSPTPLPGPSTIPTPVLPTVLRPMTVGEFAACFKPTCGMHEVLLVHPRTGCPVKVCFTLPPGCPRVCATKRKIEFDYGRCSVDIIFRIGGRVDVRQ